MNYLLIIFVILVYCIINYYIKVRKNIETFENKYEFLNSVSAFRVLGNQPYFDHFNKYDYKLRKCNKENVMNVYKNYIHNFTTEEIDAIRWLLDMLIPKMRDCIKNFPYDIWRFIKVSKLEGNMPHTRNDCIVLPAWFIKKIVKYKKNNNIEKAIKDTGLTLIHEQAHVYQKLNKSIFNRLYKKYWNFENPSKIINLHLLKNNRTNPDGLDIKWLYKTHDNTYLMPIAIYNNYAFGITDVKYVFIEIIRKNDDFYYTKRYIRMSRNDEYNIFFGTDNNYHPNETSALYFTEYFKECHKLGNISNTQAYEQFKIWLSEL